MFRYTFRYKRNDKKFEFINFNHLKDRFHIVQLLRHLEPRYYNVDEDIIQDQFCEVFEVLYIMKGKVGVGYRLFNTVFLGMVLNQRNVINDYALIQNKVSEFIYKPIIEHV